MSQRLIKKSRAWGVTQSGLAITALRGSDPGDENDEGQEGQEGSSGTDSGATGSEGDSGDEGQQQKDDKDAELEAIKARMKAADRRAAAAEAKIKEFEDKDKSESERLTADVETLRSETSRLQEALREQRLQNAFLTSNDYEWQDAEAALRLADLSSVVDEDGEIDKKALKAALKALAEGKPFLVKSQQGNEEGGKNGASGTSTGTPKSKKPVGVDEQELARRYPALASRI